MAGLNFSCKSQMLDTISSALAEMHVPVDVQEGGVRYPIVSHRRTRKLLRSPIRCCAIVDENSLRPVPIICDDGVMGAACISRERNMASGGASAVYATSAVEGHR